jgi:hypothetical protein
METMERDMINQMNKDFEQIRVCDRKENQQLKTILDNNSQTNKELVTQQEEFIKKLQAKVHLAKVTVVEMVVFQAHALEVHKKMELAQQNLFTKVEVVQSCYRVEDLSLNKIYIKER